MNSRIQFMTLVLRGGLEELVGFFVFCFVLLFFGKSHVFQGYKKTEYRKT